VELFSEPGALRAWSLTHRRAGRRVAIVPTMGALHAGHLALIDEARRLADVTVVSVFLNPLQFDRAIDLERYPAKLEDDLTACRRRAVDAVYAPTPAVMYPPDFATRVVPGGVADHFDGPLRPGHFEGVATVVTKLFGAAAPDIAVFGQKDFQQLAIVRRMVTDLDMGIEIASVATVREPDGLALSSRNVRLSPTDRAAAVAVPRAIDAARLSFAAGERSAAVLARVAERTLAAEPLARAEYVEVVDAATLSPIERVERPAVVLLAAWFGDVRLIDNTLLSAAADDQPQHAAELGVDVVEHTGQHDDHHHAVEDRVGDHGGADPTREVGGGAERDPDR
jgi:pantoate--beta-alanine ligase